MPEAPFTGAEIVAALAAQRAELAAVAAAFEPAAFFAGNTQDWGPAQHLAHLTWGHAAVSRWLADPSSHPVVAPERVRTYDEVRQAYLAALADAPAALLSANARNAEIAAGATQADVIARYERAQGMLTERATRWSEHDLDTRALPHPLLGALPAREMLLFLLYHDRHHLAGMQRGR